MLQNIAVANFPTKSCSDSDPQLILPRRHFLQAILIAMSPRFPEPALRVSTHHTNLEKCVKDQRYSCTTRDSVHAEKFGNQAWSPTAGQIKAISYDLGQHPAGTRAGAVLSEIDPAYQRWNPDSPRQGPYGGGDYYWGSINAYGGAAFNTDTRQIVCYGAGHSAINVCAPFCFDLNDLRWKWLDQPLPFDGFGRYRKSVRPGTDPTPANLGSFYPPNQYDFSWGDLSGDWPGWPAGFGRPGKIQPVPGHSRARMVHIPARNFGNTKGALFWNVTGTGSLSGVYAKSSHLFNFDSATWSRAAQQLPSDAPSSSAGSAHDAASNKIVLVGSTGPSTTVYLFDVATRTWAIKNATNKIATSIDHGGNVLHTMSGLYIVPAARNVAGNPAAGDGLTFQFFACPVSSIIGLPTFAWAQLRISAPTTWPLNDLGNNNFLGWSYCPVDGCLYTIDGVNGSSKYWKLAPPASAITQDDYLSGTWSLTEQSFVTGTVKSPGSRSMVFNRISWDSRSRSFVWFPDHIGGPVQAFRPAGII